MDFLKSLQDDVSKAVAKYMSEEQIGFNELVRRLNISPTQASKIQNGEANLHFRNNCAYICFIEEETAFNYK